MSQMGLGCVKTRRRATALERHSLKSHSRARAQRFAGASSIARWEKNYSRRFSTFCVFTQAGSLVDIPQRPFNVRLSLPAQPVDATQALMTTRPKARYA